MSDGEAGAKDRTGTFWDWPVAVIILAVVLMFAGAGVGAVVLFWFGVLSLMVRRGAFTPRRKQ